MKANARRAQEAHRRRSSGESWETIAEDLGYSSVRSVRSAVGRYAKQFDWTWPIITQANEGIPVAGFASHPEAAYKLRMSGLKWQEVGAEIGLHSPNAHAIAMRYARKYATRHNLPWPPKIDVSKMPVPDGGDAAYKLRAERLSWQEVGERTGLGSRARGRAQRYAKITGQPWPIRAMTMAEVAYQTKHENPSMSWRLVAKKAGYTHSHHAGTAARRIAFTKCEAWMREYLSDYTDPRTLADEAWESEGLHSDTLTPTPSQVLQMAESLIGG